MKNIITFLLIILPVMAFAQEEVHSELCIMNTETKEVSVVYRAGYHLEAPNWTLDGKYLIFNSDGLLYKIPVSGGTPEKINTDFANRCNNDHVLSPDGSKIAISHHDETDHQSKIYILPLEGGVPELVTPKGPSYLHGWSPAENKLTYCAERNGEYDVYVIDMETKEEEQLTDSPGLDDGPEYSPDGKYIYFNSVRTGTMQIWRMKTDGSGQTQVTFDKYNDWFAHPSPDNQWLVFISYDPSVPAGSHPPNKNVMLRRIPVSGGEPETLLKLFGGQGTINVPSWSPDSKKIAFVRYELR
ncbi:MAG: transporter [Bacteroidales bacterium]|nr:transporter [Bacteroidales bacterium]